VPKRNLLILWQLQKHPPPNPRQRGTLRIGCNQHLSITTQSRMPGEVDKHLRAFSLNLKFGTSIALLRKLNMSARSKKILTSFSADASFGAVYPACRVYQQLMDVFMQADML